LSALSATSFKLSSALFVYENDCTHYPLHSIGHPNCSTFLFEKSFQQSQLSLEWKQQEIPFWDMEKYLVWKRREKAAKKVSMLTVAYCSTSHFIL
jgi:hypothetical protein